MSNSKLAMSTHEERQIKVQIVSSFCLANNSDYSLEDIKTMDDDVLDLYITINNLGAKRGAEVLEAVHSASIPRKHSSHEDPIGNKPHSSQNIVDILEQLDREDDQIDIKVQAPQHQDEDFSDDGAVDDSHMDIFEEELVDNINDYDNLAIHYDFERDNHMSFWQHRELLQPEVERRYEAARAARVASNMNSRCDTCYKEQHCSNCYDKSKKASHSHDSKAMKDFVMQTKLWEIGSMRCNKSCKFNQNCLQRLPLGDIVSLRTGFWGKITAPAPKVNERRARQVDILLNCYNKHDKNFRFMVPSFDDKTVSTEVCESAYIVALGRHGSMDSNQVTKTWRRIKKQIVEGSLSANDKTVTSASGRPMQDYKKRHAIAYIQFITNLYRDEEVDKHCKTSFQTNICDTSPFAGMENIHILPYDNLPQFHEEYKVHCSTRGIPPCYVAGLTTFRTAFEEQTNVKFLGAKGSFNTCEVCNNLNSLLKNTKQQFTKEQRQIIHEFKRLHIAQQAKARLALEVKKLRCLELDECGQPIEALLYPDGMTEFKGETPKVGSARQSKVNDTITNRIIGVEVYCGPVKTVFIYNTDQLVRKGANVMIEIMRQATADLSTELAKRGKKLPKKMNWQFDNCAENKNKTMFAYASALVEYGYFDIMEINFLIVGHTHSSIDQYFSVLSKAIDSAEWIGSPISLQALCSQAHKPTRGDSDEIIDRRPSINRQIEVYYDVVSALKPYINDQIKFFQVPHHFLFRRVCGKCIMQYKLFPQNSTYLPQEPNEVTTLESLSKNVISKVQVSPLSIINGTETFFEHMGVPKDSNSSFIYKSDSTIQRVSAVRSMISTFEDMEQNALHQLEIRTELESEEGNCDEIKDRCLADASAEQKSIIEKFLTTESTNQRGYIMWLIEDSTKLELPPASSIRPKLIDSTIGIFDKNISVHKSMDSSVGSSTLEPTLTSGQQMNAEVNDDQVAAGVVNKEAEADLEEDEEILALESTNDHVVANLRLSRSKGKANPQLTKAKMIVNVAKNALKLMTPSTSFSQFAYTYDNKMAEFNATCWNQKMYIKPEQEYFAKRASLNLLVKYLRELFAEAAKVPWEFLPVQSLSVEDQRQMEEQQRLCQQQAEAMRFYLRSHVGRKGHGASELTEVVSRPALPLTAALINEQIDKRSNKNNRGSVGGGGRMGHGEQVGHGGRNSIKNLSTKTIPELKELLKSLNLKTSGNKGELIIRLYGSKNSDSNVPPISIAGTKRVPCALGECEEFCSVTDGICQQCPESERCYQYCSLHISHGSHSNQTSSKRRGIPAEVPELVVSNPVLAAISEVSAAIPATTGRIIRAAVHASDVPNAIVPAVVSIQSATAVGLAAVQAIVPTIEEVTATVVPALAPVVLAAAEPTADSRQEVRATANPTAIENFAVVVSEVPAAEVNAISATEESSSAKSDLAITEDELPSSTLSYNATASNPSIRPTLEEISNALKATSDKESVQKLHERIQSSISNERKKENRHKNYYERLFGELDFAEYGRDLVYLNENYYQCAVYDLAITDLSNNKNPLSKKKVRAEYLASFCRGYINQFVPN